MSSTNRQNCFCKCSISISIQYKDMFRTARNKRIYPSEKHFWKEIPKFLLAKNLNVFTIIKPRVDFRTGYKKPVCFSFKKGRFNGIKYVTGSGSIQDRISSTHPSPSKAVKYIMNHLTTSLPSGYALILRSGDKPEQKNTPIIFAVQNVKDDILWCVIGHFTAHLAHQPHWHSKVWIFKWSSAQRLWIEMAVKQQGERYSHIYI